MSKPKPLTGEQRIWQVCLMIPEGKVVSYGQLADLAGLPGRARLAGRAMRTVPEEMALPWYRVLGAGGRISLPKDSPGYREQQYRLRQEGVEVNGSRINMNRYQWQPDLAELLWQLPF